MRRWAGLALGLLAAQAGSQTCGEALGAGARRIDAAQFQLVYKLLPDPVPVGKHFAVDVLLCPKGNVALPAELRVDATMPEHKHGMNYRPSVKALAPGQYRAEGLMFHMPGRWELVFELRGNGPPLRLSAVAAARVRPPTALLALALLLPGAADTQPLASPLHDDHIPRILAFGPWPPPQVRDPSNRVSGQPAAIAFGATLFHDKRLSRGGTLSCASCHQPALGFSDGLPRAAGLQPGIRNTPGLANVSQQRWFGWDGANDNLWAQSLRPLLDAREMGGSLPQLAQQLRSQPDLREGYRKGFGQAPGDDDELVAVNAAKALAAYQETLLTPRTPFDEFRDAVARGDRAAAAHYPAAAQRGLALFLGRGRCYVCHGGPTFSNGEFSDIGRPFFIAKGQVDPGRHGGIQALQRSRYNLLGPFNDDAARSSATGTRHVLLEHRHFGEFKVPGLRNLARTAPYMHDGSLKTLREVLRHYSELDENRLHADGEAILVPLRLSEQETEDLLALLDSLNETPAPRE